MGIHVSFIRVMDIVGGHQGNAGILAQPHQLLIHIPLLRQTVILQLQKIIAVSEGLIVPEGGFLCFLIESSGKKLLHFPGQTCA